MEVCWNMMVACFIATDADFAGLRNFEETERRLTQYWPYFRCKGSKQNHGLSYFRAHTSMDIALNPSVRMLFLCFKAVLATKKVNLLNT